MSNSVPQLGPAPNSPSIEAEERVNAPLATPSSTFLDPISSGVQATMSTSTPDLAGRVSVLPLSSDTLIPSCVPTPQAKEHWFTIELEKINRIEDREQMSAFLIKMEELGINLSDPYKEKTYFSHLAAITRPTPLCDLLCEAILKTDEMCPSFITELKNYLFFAPFDDILLNAVLLQPNAHAIFNRFLEILTQDDMNNNQAVKDCVFRFAYKNRYDYLFFQLSDYEEMSNDLALCMRVNQASSASLQQLKENKKWMTYRAKASSTFALKAVPSTWQAANEFLLNPNSLQGEFSLKMLLLTHGILMKEELVPVGNDVEIRGRFRYERDIINSRYKGIVRTGTWRELYCLPQNLQRELNKFEAWLKENLAAKANPIVLAGLAHQRFLSLHPFMNGNGRLSRLLMDWILMKYNLPPPILKVEINGGLEPVFPLLPKKGDPGGLMHLIIKGIYESKTFIKND